jgi:CheY-like chemotaxis protein/HPt (histidine-containing phosphotransfer) domain-containing protein
VLVVDDGVENRQLVRVLLEEVGLRVSEAENGQVALDRVAAGGLDLLLMDMQMPVMDGQTATRRLREAGSTLPVIALTANAMKGFEREIEDAGFSGFLTKPIDVDALLGELARRLGANAVPPEPGVDGAGPSPAAAPLPADAGADAPAIVSRLAAHPRVGRIVARFVEQLPARLAQMEAAAGGGDMVELAAQAHWLKGAGGSMGFDVLFEPARLLEDAAKQGDPALARSTLAELRGIERRIRRGRGIDQARRVEEPA